MSKVAYGKLTKELIIKSVEDDLKKAQDIFFTDYNKINSNDINALRKKLSTKNAKLRVLKNSLGRRAIEKSPFKSSVNLIEGSCAIGLSQGDASEVAKVFMEFVNEHKHFSVKGAVIGGQSFDLSGVSRLATLPSREVLLAMALAGMKSPITGFARVLAEVVSSFVRVLNKVRESKDNKS